ncbi:MAG TPA: OmpA family protein [Candidatus Binatia bacterium]|jgi:outer membrane protein OmpA-like peptidoglycan-associated protein
MKVGLRFAVTSVLLVAFAVGCTCMQKPWGSGALMGAGVGAIGGGIGAGAGANNSGAFNVGNDNEDKVVAIASGAVGGALVGALIGHCLWDREAVVAQPAPPPPAPPPAPPVSKKIVLRGVNFDFNKANIRPDAAGILKEAASILKDNSTLKVSVEGHTDSVGSDQYNLKLSLRRAAAVKDFLVKEGIADSRLSTRGLGESQPVASNDTADGRAQNRRVELKVAE